MRSFKIILFLFLTILSNFSKANGRDTSVVIQVIKHGLTDTKDLFISPVKWDKKDLIIAGGVSVATGALILWADQPVYDFSNTIHNQKLDVFFRNIEPTGHTYPAMVAAAMFLKGMVYKENNSIETSLIAAESYILTGLVTQMVKTTAGRARPNYDATSHSHEWNGPFFNGTSFFSGHTSTAFSVASVFAYRYRDTKWVPILSYSLATLGGLQRIYDNRHWASDVLMGAAVGTATGIFLCKQWENNSIRFFPTLVTNGGGISMVIPIK